MIKKNSAKPNSKKFDDSKHKINKKIYFGLMVFFSIDCMKNLVLFTYTSYEQNWSTDRSKFILSFIIFFDFFLVQHKYIRLFLKYSYIFIVNEGIFNVHLSTLSNNLYFWFENKLLYPFLKVIFILIFIFIFF